MPVCTSSTSSSHEQQVLLGAQFTDSLYKGRGLREHTALTLNELEHDSAGRVVDLGFEVVQIACGRVVKALSEGEEVVVEAGLTGCLQRGHRTAMEGVPKGDDLAAALAVLVIAVLTCELDGALVGLCARVCEEDLAHTGCLDQCFCGLHHGCGGEQVGHVHELVNLFFDGVGEDGVIIA